MASKERDAESADISKIFIRGSCCNAERGLTCSMLLARLEIPRTNSKWTGVFSNGLCKVGSRPCEETIL